MVAYLLQDFPETTAKFAVWYRAQVSSEYKLVICHDSSDQEFELTPATTEDQLLNALNSD